MNYPGTIMRIKFILIFIASILFLTACAGVGVLKTSDPLEKLNEAESLTFDQGRPLLAERLIMEAMTIYKERNDNHGLGHSNRSYAELLLSNSVAVKWQKFYKENGFQDRSVTFENKETKATEYYKRAMDYYVITVVEHQKTQRYDALTNVYFNMATTSAILKNKEMACKYFENTKEAYNENIKRNPTAKPYSPKGTLIELVDQQMKRVGCN